MASNQKQQEDTQSLSYAFKQQVMKAWQPVPTLTSTIVLFSILSIFFLTMGIILISYSNDIIEVSQRYDSMCSSPNTTVFTNYTNGSNITSNFTYLNNNCSITIGIPQRMPQPIYVYYQLDNFYQNHRRYVKSKDTSQLSGSGSITTYPSDCATANTNDESQKYINFNGANFTSPNQASIPCGLIAKSLFNDTYTIYQNNTNIPINETQIAWPSDLNGRYNNLPGDWQNIQWADMTNEHFMVWMRTAALPNFRKLWGRITQDISKGQINLTINNNYPVSQFNGAKSIVLSTTNVFGGKNQFLAVAYLVVGVVCSLITIGFLIRKYLANQENKNK